MAKNPQAPPSRIEFFLEDNGNRFKVFTRRISGRVRAELKPIFKERGTAAKAVEEKYPALIEYRRMPETTEEERAAKRGYAAEHEDEIREAADELSDFNQESNRKLCRAILDYDASNIPADRRSRIDDNSGSEPWNNDFWLDQSVPAMSETVERFRRALGV